MAASNEVIHAVVNVVQGGVKLQGLIHWYGGVRVLWKEHRHFIDVASSAAPGVPPYLTALPFGQGQVRTARQNDARVTEYNREEKAKQWYAEASIHQEAVSSGLSLSK